jgi:putative transposase
MARQPRFFVPGVPLHVTQRGNNRGNIFVSSKDYRIFLDCLCEASHANGVLVHAYVLMTNHVHLLATPSDIGALPRVLQSVGRRYVQHFNRSYSRTGTLWEGRYRAAVVDSERYFLACMRYIELNPVRAGITSHPGDYRWSSYGAHANGTVDRLVAGHQLYEQLGRSPDQRGDAYRQLCEVPLANADLEAIRKATHANWALGDARFAGWIGTICGRRAIPNRTRSAAPSGSDSQRAGFRSLTPKDGV